MITHAEYDTGEILVTYQAFADRPRGWGIRIIPTILRDRVVPAREWLDSPAICELPAPWNRARAGEVDPLVHVHLRGDPLPTGYANGRTFRNSSSVEQLLVTEHGLEHLPGGQLRIRTILEHPRGLRCTHEVTTRAGGVLEVCTSAENAGSQPLMLDALSAFSLGGITPFAADDASGRLWVHRWRSVWSAEARHVVESLEGLHLERSWTGHGVRSERFGQTGSMPVNGWFPLLAVEDRAAGVTWAAQLAPPGTWHLEIYRRADQVAIGGAGADRLGGEWSKVLQPGEGYAAPMSFLTVAAGGIDLTCDRLLRAAQQRAGPPVAEEAELPIIFNEWCTSWGHPTHQSVVALADRLSGTGVRYLVIDDGWAERPSDGFQQNGDWRVNLRAFPDGLRATAAAVRARGLVPGLWFECEAINAGSAAWGEEAHQLHRDGVPLQVGNRRFWDFRDPWVHEFLTARVLDRLKEDGFGYLKIDYNDSIGPGVDGPEAPGENLRQHLAGVQRFVRRLREKIPELVIENCSSGGHRLEASFLALTAMSSSSDAHETPDIPIIAADLGRLVWSAQKQIWAVLRAGDSPARLSYSLAATFLGRMCLSGEIDRLSTDAWDFVRDATAFYREVAPLIRDGVARVERGTAGPRSQPRGYQFVLITSPDETQRLVVWHRFESPGKVSATLALPTPTEGYWFVRRQLHAPGDAGLLRNGVLEWSVARPWTGGVIWLAARD